MSKENKNIPELRFHGFESEWEEKKLEEVADVKTGPFGSSLHRHDYVELGTPIITVEHLNDLGIVHKNLPLVSDEDKIRLKSYHLKTGDLVFSRVGSVDRCSLISSKEDGWLFSGRLLRVRFKKQFPTFFNYEFQLEKTKQKVRNIAVGQTMPSINTEILKSIYLSFPTLPEQTKIADFLSAVDTKLQQLTQKKNLLEDYKKAIMQQLFSQKLRFKDEQGNDFPEWEEKRLGDICKIARSGGTPTSTNKSYYNGDIPFLSINDMTSQGKYLTQTSKYITKTGLENSSSWIVPENSLIYSMYASVGFVAINKIPIATSQAVLNLILNDNISLEFMYYTLIDFQKNITQFITIGTQSNLNAHSVKNFELPIPTLTEQTKIAEFLIAIDTKIDQVKKQIHNTQTFKKGLLQKLFV